MALGKQLDMYCHRNEDMGIGFYCYDKIKDTYLFHDKQDHFILIIANIVITTSSVYSRHRKQQNRKRNRVQALTKPMLY